VSAASIDQRADGADATLGAGREAAPAPAKAAAPAKKSKKKLFAVVAVLLLLVGGYEAKQTLLKAHYKPGQAVPLGKIVPLDQLTVNLSDGHLVQASISLQLTKVASTATITNDLPRFDDAAITALGSFTYPQLLTPQGRQQLKVQLLADCQKIAGTVDGAAQQISNVYFTGFVIQ
jgi:flagellar FliL protein